MKMKIILFICLVAAAGCSDKNAGPSHMSPQSAVPALPPVPSQAKVEEPAYKYIGEKFQDPFIPLTGGKKYARGLGVKEGEIDPATLMLKGIVIDKDSKMASLSDTAGNSYIVKDKRLYNRKGEIIEGVVGIVKLESVVIITQDKTVRELKLKSEEEY